LSHNASFHSGEKIIPSNAGTKHTGVTTYQIAYGNFWNPACLGAKGHDYLEEKTFLAEHDHIKVLFFWQDHEA
jgi:hypothetical protein